VKPLTADDQWMQDFLEFGYASMPAADGGQQVMRTAYRSANVEDPSNTNNPLRAAGWLAYTVFRGPDYAGITQFRLPPTQADADMDSLNSFGNLETIPPYSLNGQSYPLGRVIRGSIATFHPDPTFMAMLDAQPVQPM